MKTTQRSRQSFCARCAVARAVHDRLAEECAKFIEPGSKEAHELQTARDVADATSVIDMSDLQSDTIDRARLIEINRQQWAAIKLAKARLVLALDADPTMFKIHCQAALIALRGIGDS